MIRSSTALMVFALVLGVPSVSHALTCGETITADTTLTADLAGCGLYGLVVGADNVVLDLRRPRHQPRRDVCTRRRSRESDSSEEAASPSRTAA
jgi:hypothetical protein